MMVAHHTDHSVVSLSYMHLSCKGDAVSLSQEKTSVGLEPQWLFVTEGTKITTKPRRARFQN